MKNLTIILAFVFIAFTVDAQNTRSRSGDERKTEKTVRESSSPSKSSASRSSVSRSSGTSSQKSAVRSSNRSSSPSERSSAVKRTAPSSSSKSTATRSSSSSRSSVDRQTPPSGRSGNSSATRTRTNNSREVNTRGDSRESRGNSAYDRERSSERSAGSATRTRTVETGNRNSNSTRGGTNVYRPKNSTVHVEKRRSYTTYMPNRIHRPHTHIHYTVKPIEYRRIHYPYRAPRTVHIYWDVHMYREYRSWYPHYDLWYYPYGYRIHTISAYDAFKYVGEIARVYGEVDEVWYERKTDQYFMYVGGPYPYNDFTVIVDGNDARRFTRNPVRFFTKRHIEVTGLVSSFEGKPEIVVKRKKQIRTY